jgi:hypothetical protein
MPYNTQRSKMIMREYGRHVQQMVEHVASIKDEKKRNEQVKIIIELMGQMNPHLRNVEEFRHKIYDHIYIMANYNIDIESPYPKPDRAIIEKKPDPLPYPRQKLAYRHYGKNISRMIEKAKTFTEPEKKEVYVQYLANYMKLVHNNWNKENVTDDVIRQDLKVMSRGELELSSDTELQNFRTPVQQPQRNYGKQHHRHKGGGKNRNRGNNQNRNFKRNK